MCGFCFCCVSDLFPPPTPGLACGYPVDPFIEMAIHPQLNFVFTFVKNWLQILIGIFILESLFYFTDVCLNLCQYHRPLIMRAIEQILKFNILMPPALYLHFKITWLHLLIVFPYKCYNFVLVWKKKNPLGIMIAIVLNLYINLERMNSFTMLKFSIHEHNIFPHLFTSLISYISLM